MGHKDSIWMVELPFRKCNKPQFMDGIFEIVAFARKKPQGYTIKEEQSLFICEKIYEKAIEVVFWDWIRLQ